VSFSIRQGLCLDTRPNQSYIILDAWVGKKQLEAANRTIFTAKGKYLPLNSLCGLDVIRQAIPLEIRARCKVNGLHSNILITRRSCFLFATARLRRMLDCFLGLLG
jgi:hypothetical protein